METEDQFYADDYQTEEQFYTDESEAVEEEPTYDDGIADGHQTAMIAEQAAAAHALVQAGEDLRQQRETQEIWEQGQQDIEAAQGYLGRELSYGEWAHLQADALDDGGHHDVANALNDYWAQHEGQDGKPATREQREARSLNSLRAMNEEALPEYEDVLPGPNDNNYGLGDNPSRQALRDARDNWSLQRHSINEGRLGFVDDD